MFTLGFGLVGAAIAPLVCQLVTTLPRLRYVFGGRGAVRPHLGVPSLEPVREILRIGVPAALATSLSNLGIMVMTGVLARLGDANLAAYGLGTRCDFLLLSFAYGIGAAMLTLVGMAERGTTFGAGPRLRHPRRRHHRGTARRPGPGAGLAPGPVDRALHHRRSDPRGRRLLLRRSVPPIPSSESRW